MPKHPFQGITGIKPRSELPGERLPKDENQELSRNYIRSRNKKLSLSITQQEIEIAARRNELVEKRHLKFQLAYLLTGLREQIRQLPHLLPRQLKNKSEHEMAAIIRQQVDRLLQDLAQWPERITDSDWKAKIAEDLLPSAAEKG